MNCIGIEDREPGTRRGVSDARSGAAARRGRPGWTHGVDLRLDGVREPEASTAGAGLRPGGHAAARRAAVRGAAAAAQRPPRAARRRLRRRRRHRRRHGEPCVLGGVVRLEVERLVGVVLAGARPQQDPAVRGAAAVVPYPQAVGRGAERRGEEEYQEVHAREVGPAAAAPPAGAGAVATAARSRRRSVVRHGLDLERRRGCGGHEAEETGEN